MPSTSEINEIIKRNRILGYLVIFLVSIIILLAFTIQYFKVTFTILIIMVILFLVSFVINQYIQYLSAYDLIRYHLAELAKFLNEQNIKKSEYHLNELAKNIAEYDDELDDNFILNSPKKTLKNFWKLLKYQIYPCIKRNDFGGYNETVRDLNYFFENADVNTLNRTIESLLPGDSTPHEDIVLPYEKPNIFYRIINDLKNNFITLFNKNIIFRATSLVIIFSIIAYLVSLNVSFLKFDNTLIGPIVISSAAIAAGWGKK